MNCRNILIALRTESGCAYAVDQEVSIASVGDTLWYARRNPDHVSCLHIDSFQRSNFNPPLPRPDEVPLGDAVQSPAAERHVELSCQLDELACIVELDKVRVKEVLVNLLDNAIKYNVGGGTVSISLTKSDSVALFRIANTGPGIPQEHENRIFERFYRADPSRSSDTIGSGLGLSICRELVLAHGGNIWLERAQPGWTAFALTLPGPKKSVSAEQLR